MTNPSGRSTHWRLKHAEAKHWKKEVAIAVACKQPPAPLERARLTLVRYSSVSPDPDGLVSGFKHVIDGLRDAGVIANDRWENIGMPNYLWEKCAPKAGRIMVIVEEVVS